MKAFDSSFAEVNAHFEVLSPKQSPKQWKPTAYTQKTKSDSAVVDVTYLALAVAIEQKGLDVRGLDLRGLTDVADYCVIVSGTSDRHVQGVADKIERALRNIGSHPVSIVGRENAQWILLDYADLVIHVFYEPTRQYYEFDTLWKQAKPLALDPELEAQARKLRTGVVRW